MKRISIIFLTVLFILISWLVIKWTYLIIKWAYPIQEKEIPGTYVAWLPGDGGKDELILKDDGSFLQKLYLKNKVIEAEGWWTLEKRNGLYSQRIILRDIHYALTYKRGQSSFLDR
jgi:hypothetical protein